jgi:apolipoprotein N-acyltransferase
MLRVFDIVTLRAVEQHRFLARASTSGPSAIIDPWGRVLVQSEIGSEDVVAGTVQTVDATTLYCRVGDLFADICAA